MQQTVVFDALPPTWPAVRDLLARHGLALQMRMIDGELAFPDEEPAESWRELRVSGAGGMVNIRRGDRQVELIVWGNADPGLRQLWNALAWAFAESGAGRVATPNGPLDATTFRARAELPDNVGANSPGG
jgi:hypothetical protein